MSFFLVVTRLDAHDMIFAVLEARTGLVPRRTPSSTPVISLSLSARERLSPT
jgi:hypothetical protein